MKIKIFQMIFLAAILGIALPVSGCGLAGETTVHLTTTQMKTQLSPVTITDTIIKTVTSQPDSSSVTITKYITTTVPMVTTAPPPPPSTVYVTTTVIQQGIAVRQLILPADEIPAVNAFSVCMEVQNISTRDMECNIPVTVTSQDKDDYELVLHVEFFIQSGETKTVCTDDIKLLLGSYYVEAGEILREFYIVEGGG